MTTPHSQKGVADEDDDDVLRQHKINNRSIAQEMVKKMPKV